jgi:ribonuclease HI
MITEPKVVKSNVSALDRRAGDVHYALGSNPRSCIRTKTGLNPWPVSEFMNRDICTVAIKIKGRLTYVCSMYLDITFPAKNPKLVDLIDKCEREGIALLVGMDSNAHSVLWGCSVSNARGEALEDLIAEKNLRVVNSGNTSTFKTSKAESIIDVMLVNKHFDGNLSIRDWNVASDTPSFSDHRYIEFSMGEYVPEERSYRNLRKADWATFRESLLVTKLPNISPDGSNLDECADSFESMVKVALDAACPLKTSTPVKPNSWWNESLEKQRKVLRRLFNVKKNSWHHQERWREALLVYRKAILEAKKRSWKEFCSRAESSKDVSDIMKMLKSKTQRGIGLLKRDGIQVKSPEESLDVMMDAHFPDSVLTEDWESEAAPDMTSEKYPEDVEVTDFISAYKVKAALSSFGKKKAAGPDNFQPIVLQNLKDEAIEYLTQLFKSTIRSRYTPKAWRRMKVIFLAKPDKADYGVAKAYRPITLSNFLLKCLERLMQWYINDFIVTKPLCSQHAYTTGRSTETALSEALDCIEKAVSNKQHALVVSLDCSGAFDRIQFSSAKKAMKNKNIPSSIIEWYDQILNSRCVSAELQGVNRRRKPKRGSPQGGVLSPLIWNLIMDTLMTQFKGAAVTAIAYADDVLLIVTGKDFSTLVKIMQKALDKVLNWGKQNGLCFNPDKTCVVDFTRNTRFVPTKVLRMEGKDLEYSHTMKYLGVTFTRHLSWTEHVQGRIRKGIKIMNSARAVVGQNWGLNPERTLWVYTSLVRPLISYGSIVWSKELTRKMYDGLLRVQRSALTSIASPLRSTPTEGMEAILGLTPLDLFVQGEAAKARIRTRPLMSSDRWDGIGNGYKGHKRHWDDILGEICPKNYPIDRIPRIHNWTENLGLEAPPDLMIYTDGSKELESAGAGWAACIDDQLIEEESVYLGKETTVFQAEVVAINHSLQWLIDQDKMPQKRNCQILSDSEAAINAISSISIESKVVRDCVATLDRAKEKHSINIAWVKGHNDNTGNELADMLAKAGNKMPAASVAPEVPVPNATMKGLVNDLVTRSWQDRWSSSDECRRTKLFCPRVSAGTGKLKKLVKLPREQLNRLFQATTGHGLFAAHLSKWRNIDPLCKLCLEADETAVHLWDECPALTRERMERNALQAESKLFEFDVIKFFSIKAIRDMMSANSRALQKDSTTTTG